MESRRAHAFALLLAFSLLNLNFESIYGDSTVYFLDSPTRQYLRQPSPKIASLSPSEIGTTASILLGFAPPSTLSDASSLKLNELLMPNPFNRPRAILMLEVTGTEDSHLHSSFDRSPFSSAPRLMVEGNQRVNIQLPGENEVSLFPLNGVSSHVECSDKELSDFASWLGGSYVESASGPLNGELVIPLANGAFLRLHLSERADREFATSLAALISNIRQAQEIHQVLTKGDHSPAELITGRFDGIKALQDHYGKEGIVQSGMEVFVNAISRTFDSMQAAYQGKIAGIISHGSPNRELENMFDFTVTTRPPARWLEEKMASSTIPAKVAEVAFVRTTLAWITGIILLIATLLGIHFLMNMTLTKDTLLYSNVKLD